MVAKKKFYKIPSKASQMTDAEIEAWAHQVYENFIGGYQPEDYTPEIWAKFSAEIAAGAQTPPISNTKKGKI